MASIIVLLIIILIMAEYIPEQYLGNSILSLLFGLVVIIVGYAIRKGLKSMQINSVVSKMFLKLFLCGISVFGLLMLGIYLMVRYVPERNYVYFGIPMLVGFVVIVIGGAMVEGVKLRRKTAEVEKEFIDGKISIEEYTKTQEDRLKFEEIVFRGLMIVTVLKVIIKLLSN